MTVLARPGAGRVAAGRAVCADDTSEHVTWVFPDGETWVSPGLRRRGDEPALLRAQVEQWAGRELTDEEFGRVCRALPHSSVPEAIGEIVANL